MQFSNTLRLADFLILRYAPGMSAVEAAIEKVRHLDESSAMRLLAWIGAQQAKPATPPTKPAGAVAMLGFARRFNNKPKATAEWIAELRAGEES